jgi:hypothetical protein
LKRGAAQKFIAKTVRVQKMLAGNGKGNAVSKKPKSKSSFDPEHPALKRGADELADRCRDLPPRLANKAKRIFVKCCLDLYALLEKHWNRKP